MPSKGLLRSVAFLLSAAGGVAFAMPAMAEAAKPGAAQVRPVPKWLIAYKFGQTPHSIDHLRDLVLRQAQPDGAYHAMAAMAKAQKLGGLPPYTPVFTAEQLAGVNEQTGMPNELALKLVPVYRAKVAEAAKQVPAVVHASKEVPLSAFEYANGVVRLKTARDMSIDGTALPLSATANFGLLPKTLTLPNGDPAQEGAEEQMIWPTYDRSPRLPPIALDAATADRLFKGANCGAMQLELLQKGVKHAEATAAQKKCYADYAADYQKYGEPVLKATFDIQPVAVVRTDGGPTQMALRSKVVKVTVQSWRGITLKTFTGAELPAATGPNAASSAANTAPALATTPAASPAIAPAAAPAKPATPAAAAIQAPTASAPVAANGKSFDIVGVRLGMTMAEAEQIIRKHMQVGWVSKLKDPKDPNDVLARAPRLPFAEFQNFMRSDAKEQILLMTHKGSTDRVLGISRVVVVDSGLTAQTMAARLKAKYGPPLPPLSEGNVADMTWTSHFGNADAGPAAMALLRFRNSPCSTAFSSAAYNDLLFVQGTPPDNRTAAGVQVINTFGPTPMLYVWGAKSPPSNEKPVWDAQMWRGCGPTLLSSFHIDDERDMTMLSTGLFDLAAYAEHYTQAMAKLPTPKAPPL